MLVSSGADEGRRLLSVVEHLELELGHLQAELSDWQRLKAPCESADSVHEQVSLLGVTSSYSRVSYIY